MSRRSGLALAFLLFASAGSATTLDRIAAVADRQVITVSEVTQMVELRFFPRKAGQNDDDYRHDILEALIAQALRYRDVERFGAQDISADDVEARLREIEGRFATPADFAVALQKTELSLDEVRALVKRQLQVEAYIQERFAPMIFVSTDEIEAEYRGRWSAQRRQRGLPVPPLSDVTDEIRNLLRSDRLQTEVNKWTEQLRAHANVDVYAWR